MNKPGSELPALRELVSAGVIGQGDAHFARLCTSDESKQSALLEVVVALTSQYLRLGHPCVPLRVLALQQLKSTEGEIVGALPSLDVVTEVLRQSCCVTWVEARSDSMARHSSPLVLDEGGRLYVTRFFDHEQRLARALAALVGQAEEAASVDSKNFTVWRDGLDKYFPPAGEDDQQRAAAESSLRAPLTVVSGGPGTGKTSTVVKILALLFEQAKMNNGRPPVVKLLAPTGKAATRMMDAISDASERLSLSKEVFQSLGAASTIHRALGVIPQNPNRFRRGPEHPIRADVVLVDEASMVDLALMRHLVEALNPNTRLILLGDRHQLASVEAGSVLSELCSVGGSSRDAFMVELTKSYRFGKDSGIARLAGHIRSGDEEKVRVVLRQDAEDLRIHHGDFDADDDFRDLVVARYGEALRKKSPVEVLSHVGRFRVLCAHRRGRHGVESVNRAIVEHLVKAGFVPPLRKVAGSDPLFYRGRLILVTENDYDLQLFNGDIGLVWRDEAGRLVVYFDTQSGSLRSLSPAQLPQHETAYALTVHKSQGSEHDEVAFILPEPTSPLLTRELVYTAITRARHRVHLFGKDESILRAAQNSVVRHSGLAVALEQAFSRKWRPSAPR